MKTPNIIFKHSWIYDQNWKHWITLYHSPSKEKKSSQTKILPYIKKVEKLWRKHEKTILTELSKITGLKWEEKSIDCYIVKNCIPFSEPLTMPIYQPLDYFIDILTHELIHRLFTQEDNFKKLMKSWNYINRKYKKETELTKVHIPLHAIHTHIYLKFFNKKRLKRDYDLIKFQPDYKRSWGIVNETGYENIIREFIKRKK